MTKNDYILILRDGNLYKARFSSLSSIVSFIEDKDITIKMASDLSSTIENTANVFQDTHYTKNDMNNTFCTIESIDSLLSNSTYVLSSEAQTKTNDLKTVSNVNTWFNNILDNCIAVFKKEYMAMKRMMTINKDGDKKMVDYVHPPKTNILKNLGNTL